MRLGTWNCQTGLSRNWDVLDELEVDVLTVQECGPDTEAQATARGLWTCRWQRGRYQKGLAVLARPPYRIEETERSEPCLLSTLIVGPGAIRFRFVGFWAMTPTSTDDAYPQQATELIDQLPDDEHPTVVAGDFNASWRNSHHLANVAKLRARGLVNAYNSFFTIGDDTKPNHPTSYFRSLQSRPYHMDFVFVPKSWSIQAVEVGSFDDYPGTGLSDHVPVVVSMVPPP
jgi:endonuclease/exonuclease/phosphatase family metal-dependent hydrolase